MFLDAVGGFTGLFFALLSEKQKFYIPFVIILAFALFILIVLWATGKFKCRAAALCIILAAAGSAGVYEYISYRDRQIESVGGQFPPENYAPFGEDTKTVALKESAAVKFTENLPVMDGATALYPIYSAFARAVYPEKEYSVHSSEVMCHTTTGAYDSLIRGEADIIFVGGASAQQAVYAETTGKTLEFTLIGREAFVFFVNSENPIDNLSSETIRKIYSGEITDWSELGSRRSSIRAFQRAQGSGSQTALENFMGSVPLMTPPKDDVIDFMSGIV